MFNIKEPRPDIHKGKITQIGTFDSDGNGTGWAFEGSSHPNSVGHYISKDWDLYCGYTIDELKEIERNQ